MKTLAVQPPLVPLLSVSPTEWEQAEDFFSKNPESIKLQKQKEDASSHSFIKVNNEIYAMANGAYLGKGGLGNVKIGQTKNGEAFAVKIEGRGLREKEDAERKIMKILNFIEGEAVRKLETEKKFKGKEVNQKLYTVMPLKEGKELYKELYTQVIFEGKFRGQYAPNTEISEVQKLIIAIQSCQSIQELHDKRIVHADIKPHNFMANISGNTIVIGAIDFGFSKILGRDQTVIQGKPAGTDAYMSPEIRKGAFSFNSDTYALGKMFEKHLHMPAPIYEGMIEDDPKKRPELTSVIKNLTLELENKIGNQTGPEADQAKKSIEDANRYLETREFNKILTLPKKMVKEDYEAARQSTQDNKGNSGFLLQSWMRNQAKSAGSFFGKDKIRKQQLNSIHKAFEKIAADPASSQLQKAKDAMAVLSEIQRQIEQDEKNVFKSGMHKMCEYKKQEIVKAFPEHKNELSNVTSNDLDRAKEMMKTVATVEDKKQSPPNKSR